jgi:hypothetical protein
LVIGQQRTTGAVIGIDPQQDLALVRTASPLRGYHFRLDSALPHVGDEVAAIGFPIGDPITFTRGNVSGLHRQISVDGESRSGMVETDAAVNPGNSGGPLMAADGSVVGLVDAKNMDASGIAYAVPATQAIPRIAEWRSQASLSTATCSNPLGPSQAGADVPEPPGIGRQDAAGIAAALTTYFGGIDAGHYAAAYRVISPRLRSAAGYQSFVSGDATSYDYNFHVLDVRRVSTTTVDVALAFVSLQRADKAPDNSGDTCDKWTIDYSMVEDAPGSWFIDGAEAYGPSLYTTC